jgi:preprotein translocase subunit SecE
MAIGGVIGVLVAIFCLRSEAIRRWADDVALELSKVTWPKKETVTNGTIVVIAAGLFATIYIGLLDRLWGFVTMLVYGA